MQLFSIYTMISLFVIFISLLIITYFLVRVANKKYEKLQAIIKSLEIISQKNASSILIINDNLPVYKMNFHDTEDIVENFSAYILKNNKSGGINSYYHNEINYSLERLHYQNKLYYILYR